MKQMQEIPRQAEVIEILSDTQEAQNYTNQSIQRLKEEHFQQSLLYKDLELVKKSIFRYLIQGAQSGVQLEQQITKRYVEYFYDKIGIDITKEHFSQRYQLAQAEEKITDPHKIIVFGVDLLQEKKIQGFFKQQIPIKLSWINPSNVCIQFGESQNIAAILSPLKLKAKTLIQEQNPFCWIALNPYYFLGFQRQLFYRPVSISQKNLPYKQENIKETLIQQAKAQIKNSQLFIKTQSDRQFFDSKLRQYEETLYPKRRRYNNKNANPPRSQRDYDSRKYSRERSRNDRGDYKLWRSGGRNERWQSQRRNGYNSSDNRGNWEYRNNRQRLDQKFYQGHRYDRNQQNDRNNRFRNGRNNLSRNYRNDRFQDERNNRFWEDRGNRQNRRQKSRYENNDVSISYVEDAPQPQRSRSNSSISLKSLKNSVHSNSSEQSLSFIYKCQNQQKTLQQDESISLEYNKKYQSQSKVDQSILNDSQYYEPVEKVQEDDNQSIELDQIIQAESNKHVNRNPMIRGQKMQKNRSSSINNKNEPINANSRYGKHFNRNASGNSGKFPRKSNPNRYDLYRAQLKSATKQHTQSLEEDESISY